MLDRLKSIQNFCLAVILIFLFIPAGHAQTSADKYAALPPFLTTTVKPNVLLAMDFSGSMQAPANFTGEHLGYYTSRVASYVGEWHWEDTNNGWIQFIDIQSMSNDYDSTKEYYGYFDSNAYYEYDSTEKCWEIGDLPSTSSPPGNVGESLSGNLLNFLLMSRIDVALKSLIGGKAELENGNYILESQGAERTVEVPNLGIKCHIYPVNPSEGSYEDKDILFSIEDLDMDTTSEIGKTDSDLYARVKAGAKHPEGIVQKNEDKVRFGLLLYADNSNTGIEEGTIKYGFGVGADLTVDGENVDNLVKALETAVPYYGTHTGEAMEEAYNYLSQNGDMYDYNSGYDDNGQETEVDPYYYKYEDGTTDPAYCRKSYVVLVSDGEWNGDVDPDKWAYKLHTEDLRTATGFPGNQTADVYSLFTFSDDIQGEQSMKTIAAFGNFKDQDNCAVDLPYDFYDPTGTNDEDSRYVSFPRSNCGSSDPDACCAEWDEDDAELDDDDADPDGVPDAFFSAENGAAMSTALTQIFKNIKAGTSSGTAVTAITSRTSSGSAISQAVFYPEKEFENGEKVTWTGNVLTEWYLNARMNGKLVQNIREDTIQNKKLDVIGDHILEYTIDEQTDVLQVEAYESDTDGTKKSDTPVATRSNLEDVKNLLNFGEKLKETGADDRKIFVVDEDDTLSVEGDPTSGDRLQPFTTTNYNNNKDVYENLLGTSAAEFPEGLKDSDTGPIQYENLIDFVRGEEPAGSRYRSRIADSSGKVWKLGDIISSSPTTVNYGSYRLLFTGSNDGMLHAFRLGAIRNLGKTSQPSQLCDDNSGECTDNELAKEEWAFIPTDAMPYLRYMADKSYEHMYTVDQKPYIINADGKTYLIGGMRFGGATGAVSRPTDISDTDSMSNIGFSSYFALDITEPLNPEYLWRFTDPNLGFTYTGPAYFKREKEVGDGYNHYLVFGSGPTEYDGTSAQMLRVFVVDLLTGELLHTFTPGNTSNAYGGRLFTDGLDYGANGQKDGQTDFAFMGFTNDPSGGSGDGDFTGMSGGIVRIRATGDGSDVGDWHVNKWLTSSVGHPVTAPVEVMECFSTPYIYFGTGRYFVPDDDCGIDGANVANYLYGVPLVLDNQGDVETINQIQNAGDLECGNIAEHNVKASWKVQLNIQDPPFLGERCNTAPSTTDDNIVLFDTSMPTDKVCECGGKSRSWALNCATGLGLATTHCGGTYLIDPEEGFKYLVQLSGGDIQQPERGDFSGGTDGSTAFRKGVTSDEGGTLTEPFTKTKYWKQR